MDNDTSQQHFTTQCAAPPPGVVIAPLDADEFPNFFYYLNDHLSDNGAAAGVFQPLPRDGSLFPPARAEAFSMGMATPVGAPGWRRAWIARAPDGRIAGHIDLRGWPDQCAAHRCLLGMGVHRDHRRIGLGAALIAHARAWAVQAGGLEWIDLQVIGENRPALALYRHAGFVVTGETADMFRIDGQSFSYATMHLSLLSGSKRRG